MKNFNSNCSKDGIEYEDVVIAYEVSSNDSKIVARDFPIPGCGVEIDFILDVPLTSKDGNHSKTLRKYAQAKGGKPGKSRKPGARRTDSVKKAIADGFLLKATDPDLWYTVYFSEKPKEGSASEAMINSAVSSGLIDEVCYVAY